MGVGDVRRKRDVEELRDEEWEVGKNGIWEGVKDVVDGGVGGEGKDEFGGGNGGKVVYGGVGEE